MRARYRCLFAGMMVLVSSAAFAQSAPEHLIVPPPKDWVPLPINKQANLTVVQMLPAGESPQAFHESIVVQRQDGEKKTPKDYVLSVVAGSKANCEGIITSPISERPVNGYKAAEVRFACTKSSRTGKSGLMMVKAIAGNDALHVVQRIWLGAPVAPNQPVPVPDAVIDAWDAFDAFIVLCDSRDSKHACPK
ncbi:MAG TPA: hypothetical protein HPQ04_12600 [Rhodospirillaceae bacterium]|nr:hypothetical protein [Rhodospirillaceae bacterium]